MVVSKTVPIVKKENNPSPSEGNPVQATNDLTDDDYDYQVLITHCTNY